MAEEMRMTVKYEVASCDGPGQSITAYESFPFDKGGNTQIEGKDMADAVPGLATQADTMTNEAQGLVTIQTQEFNNTWWKLDKYLDCTAYELDNRRKNYGTGEPWWKLDLSMKELRKMCIAADRGVPYYADCSDEELRRFVTGRGLSGRVTRFNRQNFIKKLEYADANLCFPFFEQLPTEVRVMIYKEYFASLPRYEVMPSQPPVLRTSRLLRQEAIALYYRHLIFGVDFPEKAATCPDCGIQHGYYPGCFSKKQQAWLDALKPEYFQNMDWGINLRLPNECVACFVSFNRQTNKIRWISFIEQCEHVNAARRADCVDEAVRLVDALDERMKVITKADLHPVFDKHLFADLLKVTYEVLNDPEWP